MPTIWVSMAYRMLFVLLTTFLMPICILASWHVSSGACANT